MSTFTASDARKTTDRVFKAIDRRNAKSRRKASQRCKTKAQAMAEKLLPGILSDIKKQCKQGRYIQYGVYERSMGDTSEQDVIEVRAYGIVMEKLGKAPYNYKVEKEEHEGYSGEGNNMSDFYTHHTWTVSW